MKISQKVISRVSPALALVGAVLASVAISACVSAPPAYVSKLDPLQLQQMQTQEFETSKRAVFAATVSTFQDQGFMMAAADLDTGIITAKSATQSKTDYIWTGTTVGSALRASAFIEEIRPKFVRVRLSFVEVNETRELYGGGGVQETPIEKPEFYEKMFLRIREAVFVRDAHAPAQ